MKTIKLSLIPAEVDLLIAGLDGLWLDTEQTKTAQTIVKKLEKNHRITVDNGQTLTEYWEQR